MAAEDRKLEQFQLYSKTPTYVKHTALEDNLAILVCQIKIWQAKGTDWFNIPSVNSCLTIRECESIEINSSAKDLVGKAVLKFPRGTVIHVSSNKTRPVTTGDIDNKDVYTDNLENTSNDGEVITTQIAVFADDQVSVTPMAVHYDDKGLIDFNRTKTEASLLQPDDISVGNRIEIRLGYAYSEQEFNKMNSSDGLNMDMVFTGFITSVSVTTPLEIECANMAHVLETVSVQQNIVVKSTMTIKDFLDDDGKFHLLKDTGISLAESSKALDISVSGASISNNLSVAAVLEEWGKAGILCMMEDTQDGKSHLRVGLTYFAGNGGGSLPNNDRRYITYNNGNKSVAIIQFDWDVANDKLSFVHNDKKYLAVEATGRKDNKFFKFTLLKRPDADDDGWIIDENGAENYDGQFVLVNKHEPSEKKKKKKKGGTKKTTVAIDEYGPQVKTETQKSGKTNKTKFSDKMSMKKYNVIHYFSPKANITEKELIEEAKQYWAHYVSNGISGSIEIFGDVFIKPTDIVGLVDMRQPEKNGYYYVESVDTTFGTDGYRRELKFPFKIASIENVTII